MMNKFYEKYRIANILLVGGMLLFIIGYFFQTILLPIQDIELCTMEELLKLQKELALNYSLGQVLMILGGIGFFISVIIYLYSFYEYNGP